MKYGQKLLTMLLLAALIVIAVVIRGPLEIFGGNTKDFLFELEDFLPIMLALAIVVFGVLGAVAAFLPDIPFLIVSILSLWLGVSMWVQDMFLNKKLTEVNGGPMDWGTLGALSQINAVIWIVLLAGVVYLCVKFYKTWTFWARLIAGALCLIQLLACVAVLISLPSKNDQEVCYLSGEKQMQLAREENVIVLVFDSLTTKAVQSMLEQYPEAAAILKDFTLYENACSNYFPTYPSVTHYLTGYDLELESTAPDWMRHAWNSESCNHFYQTLQEADYTCRHYQKSVDYTYGGVENLKGKFENIAPITLKADRAALVKKLLKLSTYRFAPYICKPAFEVITSDFDNIVVSTDVPLCTTRNADFYQRLLNEGLSVDPYMENLFVYEHFTGAHPPFATDSQVNSVEQGSVSEEECVRGLFSILDEYLSQLKALGAYDRSAIIIMADHGQYGGYGSGLIPVFYVKQFGETHDHTQISTAPIEHGDFQATVMELIGWNDGSFGSSIFDFAPGEARQRTLWMPVNDEAWPSVAGANCNVLKGWTYFKDAEEFEDRYRNSAPDHIEPTNLWKNTAGAGR